MAIGAQEPEDHFEEYSKKGGHRLEILEVQQIILNSVINIWFIYELQMPMHIDPCLCTWPEVLLSNR